MLHMNKGFIMLDSLISVFIVIYICSMCFIIYKSIDRYERSYELYIEKSDDYYSDIYSSLEYCMPCIVDEYD